MGLDGPQAGFYLGKKKRAWILTLLLYDSISSLTTYFSAPTAPESALKDL